MNVYTEIHTIIRRILCSFLYPGILFLYSFKVRISSTKLYQLFPSISSKHSGWWEQTLHLCDCTEALMMFQYNLEGTSCHQRSYSIKRIQSVWYKKKVNEYKLLDWCSQSMMSFLHFKWVNGLCQCQQLGMSRRNVLTWKWWRNRKVFRKSTWAAADFVLSTFGGKNNHADLKASITEVWMN